LFRTSDLKKGS